MNLVIRASSPSLEHRLRGAWRRLEAVLPPDDAARLVRSCLVYAVHVGEHQAFVCGSKLPRPDDPVFLLTAERENQKAEGVAVSSSEALNVIVISASPTTPLAYILAHEAGHVLLGHTEAPAPESQEAENQQEEEVDALVRAWGVL